MASLSLRCVPLVELPCWLALSKFGYPHVEVIGDVYVCHLGHIMLDLKHCNSLLEFRVVDFLKQHPDLSFFCHEFPLVLEDDKHFSHLLQK